MKAHAAEKERKSKEWRDELYSLRESKKEKTELVKSLQGLEARKAELEAENRDLLQKIVIIGSMIDENRSISGDKDLFKKLGVEFEKAIGEMQNREAAYLSAYQSYLTEQAGIIAESLEPGMPCPVCGSTEHPRPAVKSMSAPTREQLDALQDEAVETRKNSEELSRKLNVLKTSISERESALKRRMAEMRIGQDPEPSEGLLEETVSGLKERSQAVSHEMEDMDKGIASRVALEAEIGKISENEEKYQTIAEEAEKETVSLHAEAEEIDSQIKILDGKLRFATAKEAEDELELQVQKKDALETEIREAEEACLKISTEVERLLAVRDTAEKALEGKTEIDLEAEKERKAELDDQINYENNRLTMLLHRLETNRSIRDNLDERSGKHKDLENRMAVIRPLSQTANGTLTGKEKVMLETYIQMTFFDRIIEKANRRLLIMTGEQYELKRRIESDNLRSQSGLELDVIDHYNGSQRSVRSLSGGESFKASLSLALGLSDEIQSSAGGVKLDTMFVDEGFGSLDENSLQQAYEALAGLTEGNRLVGIISHVSDLKDKIDKQIIVTKEKSGGSRAEIRDFS